MCTISKLGKILEMFKRRESSENKEIKEILNGKSPGNGLSRREILEKSGNVLIQEKYCLLETILLASLFFNVMGSRHI